MTEYPSPVPEKEYFSTGDVASHCGVTPNAVFKWVQEGKIAANRTPGGHIRISRTSLRDFLKSHLTKSSAPNLRQVFKYCWEFHSRFGKIQENCRKCIVYKSRALRCYELINFADTIGHSKIYCTSSCYECDYYEMIHAELSRLLVITHSEDLKKIFQEHSSNYECNVQFAEDEYECSKIIESYRPEYIVIDCSESEKSEKNSKFNQELIKNISNDLRIPLARIIVLGDTNLNSGEYKGRISSYVGEPFSVRAMLEFINKS